MALMDRPRSTVTADDSDNSSSDEADDHHDHEPEVQTEDLPPLPETNIVNYPQENSTYFLGKRYVRTDRVKLETILDLVGNQGNRDFIRIPELIEI